MIIHIHLFNDNIYDLRRIEPKFIKIFIFFFKCQKIRCVISYPTLTITKHLGGTRPTLVFYEGGYPYNSFNSYIFKLP